MSVAVIGGGPAGLMAAEVLSAAGLKVTVYEKMPSVGRKLLMAGRGGLNLTHSEPPVAFLERYAEAAPKVVKWLRAFPPSDLIDWANGLGQATFVGTSGRVFPEAMKASPLLRAWLKRLEAQGVRIVTRAEWRGWDDDGALVFEGAEPVKPDATILALGGASWPKLGSDGGWAGLLRAKGVEVIPFRPANSGFLVAWSDFFRDRFAGEPLKSVAVSFGGRTVRGEAMIARYGLEGGAVYALSAAIREALERDGTAELMIDLRPDVKAERIAERIIAAGRGPSLGNLLRKAAGLTPTATALLREAYAPLPRDPRTLAAAVKQVFVPLTGVAPMERAISTAGGVALDAVDDGLRLKALPGVQAVGEMLDWEAPTGGYLLQACFASGVVAARALLAG